MTILDEPTRTADLPPVSPAAGVEMLAKPGDRVTAGAALLRLHTDEPARIERALAALDGAVRVGDAAPARGDLVLDRIAPDSGRV